MTKVIFEELCPAGIPLIFCAPENAQKLPVVFYIHGFAGDKRGGVEIAYNLAQRGIATVSLDAALHGGRLDFRVATTWEGPQKGDLYPFATGLDRFFLIMKIIEDTLEDISKLLDTFREDPRLDGQRMGICGASMGGFIAYCFAAKNPSVKALATLISFPSLKQRWQDSILESSLQPAYAEQMAGLLSVTEERTKVVDALDPVEGLKKFAPKPLLMVMRRSGYRHAQILLSSFLRADETILRGKARESAVQGPSRCDSPRDLRNGQRCGGLVCQEPVTRGTMVKYQRIAGRDGRVV